jgi:hypothetical protein
MSNVGPRNMNFKGIADESDTEVSRITLGRTLA